MVDVADSKKKDALFSEKLQRVTTEIQTFIKINFEIEYQSLWCTCSQSLKIINKTIQN